MSNKHFDDLPEQPVAVKGIEKPKPASEFLEPYYKTLGDGTLELLGIIEIKKDFTIYNDYSCPHIKDGKLSTVVIGTNEGGYNSVGFCGECLLEVLSSPSDKQIIESL